MNPGRARCVDCGKTWDNQNAQASAAAHAKRTGHETIDTVCFNPMYHYNASRAPSGGLR